MQNKNQKESKEQKAEMTDLIEKYKLEGKAKN